MGKKFVVVPTNSPAYVIEVENDEDQYEALKKAIGGGMLEATIVEGNPELTMYCDEEGLLKEGMHVNAWASLNHPQRYIMGDVVITGGVDEEGYENGVPSHVIAEILLRANGGEG